MDYTREITNNAYGTRSSLNHQPTADSRVAQGAYSADTTFNYYLTGQGGEGFLEPGHNVNPEDSPTSHGTPFLTEGESPEQGCYEDEDFTRTLTPEQAAPILWNNPCQLGSYLNNAAPVDPLSSAGHVDNHCLGGTVENEHVSCHLDLSQDELNKNMKLFLESIAPEPVPSSSTNITYPDSSLGVGLSFGANHYIPSHLTGEPATTTCLPYAPADYGCPPFDPCPSVAQNLVAPYTQTHSGQLATTYGTNPPPSHSLAAPAMEERGWHQHTFSPIHEQKPRTSTSRRHHRYNPYPQAPRAGPSASTSVLGMGSASPVESSSRLPNANQVDDGGLFVSPNYPLSQTLGPDMEPVVQDAGTDLENRPHYCRWGTCSAGPMGRKAILQHFREHAVILENGRVKERLWLGCESGGRFPMTWSGFKRHVNETQSHVGLFKQVVSETCGKSLGTRSVRKHRKSCPKLGNRVESEKGKGKKRQDRRNA